MSVILPGTCVRSHSSLYSSSREGEEPGDDWEWFRISSILDAHYEPFGDNQFEFTIVVCYMVPMAVS